MQRQSKDGETLQANNPHTMDTSERSSNKRSREEREESSNKTIRTTGESRGPISQEVGMDVDEAEWINTKKILQEERIPCCQMGGRRSEKRNPSLPNAT